MYGDTFVGSLWPVVLGVAIIAAGIYYAWLKVTAGKRRREYERWKANYDAREADRKAERKAAKRAAKNTAKEASRPLSDTEGDR